MSDAIERKLVREFNCYYDLYLPPGKLPRPLMIALHGYGGNKSSMLNLMKKINDRDLVIASLQGPHQHLNLPRTAGEELKYGFGWLTNFKPEESIAIHHQNLEQIISDLAAENLIVKDRIFLLGFSQSVAMNFRFAFTRPGLIKGVIAICGGIPGDWNSDGKYQKCDLDILYLSGSKDEFYPPDRIKAASTALLNRARSVDLQFFEAGHEFPKDSYSLINSWLKAHSTSSNSSFAPISTPLNT